MAFVSKNSAEEQDASAGIGDTLDFDPLDAAVVKVHYDVGAWTFDQTAELSEAMAENLIPHVWDGAELVIPESHEERMDVIFERLEEELGPFPVALDVDAESTEFNLDEWSDSDRTVLTQALVAAEVPHRWEASIIVVAADAETVVDDMLDAIEGGDLDGSAGSGGHEPPEGTLSAMFLAADKLAKDPVDAGSRTKLIDLYEIIDKQHPPYALAPRVWAGAVAGVGRLVDRFEADASSHGDSQSDSDVIELAQQLRTHLRDYV